MKKFCAVVVATVTIIGLSSGPAAATTQGPPVTTGWICKYFPTRC